MGTYALLLRGVNVGGRASLPMAQLRSALENAGYDGVRTYLQSGNAVITTTTPATKLREQVEAAIESAVGRRIAVLIRSRAQLRKVVERWPFDVDGPATSKHVFFLAAAADTEHLRDVDAGAYAPEQFATDGPHVYLWLPNGLGRSKLAPVLTRKLGKTVNTARNWNTIAALLQMTESAG